MVVRSRQRPVGKRDRPPALGHAGDPRVAHAQHQLGRVHAHVAPALERAGARATPASAPAAGRARGFARPGRGPGVHPCAQRILDPVTAAPAALSHNPFRRIVGDVRMERRARGGLPAGAHRLRHGSARARWRTTRCRSCSTATSASGRCSASGSCTASTRSCSGPRPTTTCWCPTRRTSAGATAGSGSSSRCWATACSPSTAATTGARGGSCCPPSTASGSSSRPWR